MRVEHDGTRKHETPAGQPVLEAAAAVARDAAIEQRTDQQQQAPAPRQIAIEGLQLGPRQQAGRPTDQQHLAALRAAEQLRRSDRPRLQAVAAQLVGQQAVAGVRIGVAGRLAMPRREADRDRTRLGHREQRREQLGLAAKGADRALTTHREATLRQRTRRQVAATSRARHDEDALAQLEPRDAERLGAQGRRRRIGLDVDEAGVQPVGPRRELAQELARLGVDRVAAGRCRCHQQGQLDALA